MTHAASLVYFALSMMLPNAALAKHGTERLDYSFKKTYHSGGYWATLNHSLSNIHILIILKTCYSVALPIHCSINLWKKTQLATEERWCLILSVQIIWNLMSNLLSIKTEDHVTKKETQKNKDYHWMNMLKTFKTNFVSFLSDHKVKKLVPDFLLCLI